MNKRVHLLISGRVQGVCFRMYTQAEAERRLLTGWVRNLWDGRVEVCAEGEQDALASFVAWCRHGPRHARVTGFEAQYAEATGEFGSFDVTYG